MSDPMGLSAIDTILETERQKMLGDKFPQPWHNQPAAMTQGGTITGARSPLETQVGGDHYKKMRIQPVEFITANSLPFLEGCIIKRICRWRDKDGVLDLEKARHEIDLLIEAHKKGF